MGMERSGRRAKSALLLGAGILIAGVLFSPVRSWAQEEPSLVVLAEQVQALTRRMDALDALWINAEPKVTATGACIVGSGGGNARLHGHEVPGRVR